MPSTTSIYMMILIAIRIIFFMNLYTNYAFLYLLYFYNINMHLKIYLPLVTWHIKLLRGEHLFRNLAFGANVPNEMNSIFSNTSNWYLERVRTCGFWTYKSSLLCQYALVQAISVIWSLMSTISPQKISIIQILMSICVK